MSFLTIVLFNEALFREQIWFLLQLPGVWQREMQSICLCICYVLFATRHDIHGSVNFYFWVFMLHPIILFLSYLCLSVSSIFTYLYRSLPLFFYLCIFQVSLLSSAWCFVLLIWTHTLFTLTFRFRNMVKQMKILFKILIMIMFQL